MIRPGLVSITFRALPAANVLELTARSGLSSIEWGGDRHCPHGDLATARSLGRQTRDAGIAVAAYGSYYRLGHESDRDVPLFNTVLATALALESPRIRVWAGRRSPAMADAAYRRRIVRDALRVASVAADQGVEIVTEYHVGTLTETTESTKAFFDAADHPNLYTLWQPPPGPVGMARRDSLQQVRSRLRGLHVFTWQTTCDGIAQRLSLAAGASEWQDWLDLASQTGQQLDALIEFVRDDSPGQLLEDADTLKKWLEPINQSKETTRCDRKYP